MNMRRLMLLSFLIIGMGIKLSAMSTSSIRTNALFLTDKMAYELSLTNAQCNDVYEINYDFISAINDIMPNVINGETWALDNYYNALDIRNDDLRWVLSSYQYRLFLNRNYFCRPFYETSSNWVLRIFLRYTNINRFYRNRPSRYYSYYGGHVRDGFSNNSYYRYRYTRISHNSSPFYKNSKGYYYNTYARDFKNGGYRINGRDNNYNRNINNNRSDYNNVYNTAPGRSSYQSNRKSNYNNNRNVNNNSYNYNNVNNNSSSTSGRNPFSNGNRNSNYNNNRNVNNNKVNNTPSSTPGRNPFSNGNRNSNYNNNGNTNNKVNGSTNMNYNRSNTDIKKINNNGYDKSAESNKSGNSQSNHRE